MPSIPAFLTEVLGRAQARGLLGAVPLEQQVAHAEGFADAVESTGRWGSDGGWDPKALPEPRRWLDLGAGGGLPGLVLAWRWHHSKGVLLDSSRRRAEFLGEAVESLGWSGRIEVVHARAEVAGRDLQLRARHDVVVVRSFGPPPVTAECAAPFLAQGGILVVSEPPEQPQAASRWPAVELRRVGLAPLALWRGSFGYQLLEQVERCPDRFPRRPGIPEKRPLYTR